MFYGLVYYPFYEHVKIHSRRCRKGQTQRNNKSTQIELVTQPLHGDEASIDIQPESSENFGRGQMVWKCPGKVSRKSGNCRILKQRAINSTENTRKS